MKKSKIILGLLLIAFIGVFFACEETENVGPTITIAVIGDETGWRGDTIKYLVTWSEGDKKIENLTITPSTAGANTSSTVDIEITSDITSYEYIYVISGQAVEGTISITFTIIDKNDEIDEEIKTIIIETRGYSGVLKPINLSISTLKSTGQLSETDIAQIKSKINFWRKKLNV